jgi:hypothetical protein
MLWMFPRVGSVAAIRRKGSTKYGDEVVRAIEKVE